jgi:urea transport system permease protein
VVSKSYPGSGRPFRHLFILAALIVPAIFAGILFVPQVGIISPSSMGVVPSIEMVIWVAVGGRGTLIGAILGALLVGYGKSFFSETYLDIWQYFLGLLFVGSVLLFPQGLVGTLQKVTSFFSRRREAAAPPEPVRPQSSEPQRVTPSLQSRNAEGGS